MISIFRVVFLLPNFNGTTPNINLNSKYVFERHNNCKPMHTYFETIFYSCFQRDSQSVNIEKIKREMDSQPLFVA